MPYPVYYSGSIGITPRVNDQDAWLFSTLTDQTSNETEGAFLALVQTASRTTAEWYARFLHLGRMHASLSPSKEASCHGLPLWLEILIKHFFEPRGYVLHGEISWRASENAADRGSIFVADNRIEVVDDVILNPGPSWKRSRFADAELTGVIEALIESADDTGCTEDLTVVSAHALDALRERYFSR